MKKIGFIFFAICLYALPAWALNIPPLAGQRVHDLAGVLSETQKQTLTQRLADFEKTTSNQVALLIIPTLEGELIENFSLQVAEAWKIGQKGRDNGLLIVIAVKDRKYRFEVGYGLEGALPDGFVGSVGRQYFRPNFQQGDYFTGITQALEAIEKASKGEYQAMPAKPEKRADSFNQAIMSLIIALAIIRSFRNQFMGGVVGFLEGIIFSSMLWTTTAAFVVAALVGGIVGWLLASANNRFMGGYGGYGGYWSSSSSGPADFFSGGGGSFGGGGASGNW